jgi:hypothetical protein
MRFRDTEQVAEKAITRETAPAPVSGAPRWRRFLTPWRSPADQPAWARPALLAIAAVAAVAYGWGMAGASVETFYGAAARSMSESWHGFIFGAFDPAGTVTVDKLPGALWVQALSLRIFGFTSGRWSGPGPAGAVDRVALHQAAPAPAPPSGPVRELLLRTRAGQPAR